MNKRPFRIDWDAGTIIIGTQMITGYTYWHNEEKGGLVEIHTPGTSYAIRRDVVGTAVFDDTVNKLMQIGKAAV